MKRREIRESAFKLTFESLFRDDSADEIIALAEDVEEITLNDGNTFVQIVPSNRQVTIQ